LGGVRIFDSVCDKTPGQIINEFDEMLAVEKQRRSQGQRNDLKDTSGNVSGSYESESREKAAEKVDGGAQIAIGCILRTVAVVGACVVEGPVV